MRVHGNFKDAKNKGVCANCSSKFESYDSTKFCSGSCYHDFRLKNSILHNHKCSDCGKKTYPRNKRCRECFSKSTRGRKLTESHKEKIKKNLIVKRGKESNFYIDGTASLSRLIRNCEKNSIWRRSVFLRDDFTCQWCSVRGSYIQADHIIPFRKIFLDFLESYNQFSPIEDKDTLLRLSFSYDPFWDINNGRTLCKSCHFKTETHGRPEVKRCA